MPYTSDARLRIREVAVYSDADRGALHVRSCDEAVRLGPGPSRESYLVQKPVLAAAKATGADAIHPGYGFLSENAAFARACLAAGLTFIGPPAEAMDQMGEKTRARRTMIAAGVPVVPGLQEAIANTPEAVAEARRLAVEFGYPIMLKAAAGGGGKGMRLIADPQEFEGALDRVSLPMEEPRSRPVGRPRKGAAKRPVARNFRMAWCGTVTLHDAEGHGLHTIRYGLMPGADPVELVTSLAGDVAKLLEKRPDLRVAALADGAHDLILELWGSGKRRVRADGARPVHEAVRYLLNHRKRMNYAHARRAGLPIGSGTVEASCKTLVETRMKRAGSRWKESTGDHVIQLRALQLSDRWDEAMALTLAPLRKAVREVA